MRHVARMGETRNSYKILVGNLKVRYHLQDVGFEWMIILKWIINKLYIS
jgi:hypothetical protein